LIIFKSYNLFSLMKNSILLVFILTLALLGVNAASQEAVWPAKTTYHSQKVNGHNIFYREAGDPSKTTIILLHGYPSSSHTYRELIPLLSGRYHVIAPDNLGSGYSDKPDPESTEYDFVLLAEHINDLIEALDIKEYVIYMQDFGAPVGYRVMMKDPAKVKAIIAQNANAYSEGIPKEKQEFFNNAQLDQSPDNVAKLFAFTSSDAVKNKQYLRDVKGREEIMSPDTWTVDSYFLQTEKERIIPVELFQDYKTNLDTYPEWQKFLKENQFPALIVWGKNDPVFTEAGARAYLKDLPNAELCLLDAGHFAAEENPVEVAKQITLFLDKLGY